MCRGGVMPADRVIGWCALLFCACTSTFRWWALLDRTQRPEMMKWSSLPGSDVTQLQFLTKTGPGCRLSHCYWASLSVADVLCFFFFSRSEKCNKATWPTLARCCMKGSPLTLMHTDMRSGTWQYFLPAFPKCLAVNVALWGLRNFRICPYIWSGLCQDFSSFAGLANTLDGLICWCFGLLAGENFASSFLTSSTKEWLLGGKTSCRSREFFFFFYVSSAVNEPGSDMYSPLGS